MEEINPRHCGCLFLLLQDTLQYHRPDPHDLNRARRPSTGVTMLLAMPQGRDGQASTGSELLLYHLLEVDHQSKYVKALRPLVAIKKELEHTSKTCSQHKNTSQDYDIHSNPR